ncbi:MAG: hypothetical protein CSA81_14585, partial [Acidobacteria bacterium]
HFLFAQKPLGYFNETNLQEILQIKRTIGVGEKSVDFPLAELLEQKSILTSGENLTSGESLAKQKKSISEIENIQFCPATVREVSACDLLKTLEEKTQVKKISLLNFRQEKLTAFLEEIAPQFEKEKKEPVLEFNEEKNQLIVQTKGANGHFLDKEKSLEKLFSDLKTNIKQKHFSLATVAVEPEISTDNLEQLGIKQKIATGQSNFIRSPKNRIHNIKVATSRFRGQVIPPKTEFSFVNILGPVDESTGYKEELVIKNNETIPEFGGGVCQVSTTLFRAVINAGFEITERRNHAYPVQYYAPQGTDATIYIPHPDLRFVNNTDHHVLLQPKIEGHLLTFDIYGTNDGRQVKIEGPTVYSRNTKLPSLKL